MKILEIFGAPISHGGQESFVMETVGHMDRSGLEIDLLTPYYCDNELYRGTVAGWGGSITALGLDFAPGKSRRLIYKPLKDYLSTHRYDTVHIHSGSISVLVYAAMAARKAGVKRILVHSHAAGSVKNIKYKVLKAVSAPFMRRYPTDWLACSAEAGEWKYPQDILEGSMIILPNGVDPERFSCDPNVRERMRAQLGIEEDAPVIGQVGRLAYPKNQLFTLEVFAGYVRTCDDPSRPRLILVGDGEDRAQIEARISGLGLQDRVILTGSVDNVPDWLQAMDAAVMPSFFEGFPIVAVECQAAGLPVLMSDTITDRAAITDGAVYLPLSDTQAWIDGLKAAVAAGRTQDPAAALRQAGLDVGTVAASLRDIYLK